MFLKIVTRKYKVQSLDENHLLIEVDAENEKSLLDYICNHYPTLKILEKFDVEIIEEMLPELKRLEDEFYERKTNEKL